MSHTLCVNPPPSIKLPENNCFLPGATFSNRDWKERPSERMIKIRRLKMSCFYKRTYRLCSSQSWSYSCYRNRKAPRPTWQMSRALNKLPDLKRGGAHNRCSEPTLKGRILSKDSIYRTVRLGYKSLSNELCSFTNINIKDQVWVTQKRHAGLWQRSVLDEKCSIWMQLMTFVMFCWQWDFFSARKAGCGAGNKRISL